MVLHRDCSRCDRKQLSLLTSGAPKRFVASNASVIAIVALCANRVSNRYRIRWGASEKCREHHGILNGAPKRIRTANRQNRNLMRYPVAPWVRMNDLNYSTDICISKHNLRFSTCNILVTYKRCGDIIIIEKNILFLEKNILSNVV